MLCLVVHQTLNIVKGLSHIEEVCCGTHYQTTLKHPNLKLFFKVNCSIEANKLLTIFYETFQRNRVDSEFNSEQKKTGNQWQRQR